jgi:hypothetical protein
MVVRSVQVTDSRPRRKGRYRHADAMRVRDKFILRDALR